MSKQPEGNPDGDEIQIEEVVSSYLDEKNPVYPPGFYQEIADLFNAWAGFEEALMRWLIALMDVDDDIGRIVLDRLDTRAKLDRIRAIYDHLGNENMGKQSRK